VSVLSYAETYLLARDVTPAYAALLRSRIRRFVAWAGGSLSIDALDCDIVNRFLVALQQTETSRITIDNYRRAILCVWRAAYLERENNNPPLRVRTIRRPRRLVQAFTQDELRLLLKTAEQLQGYFPNGVRRSDFWTAAVAGAYSTGLRRGDLLRIKKSDIRTDGLVQIVQSKTGYPVAVKLSAGALAAIRRMPLEIELAFPWPFHENAMPRAFRALVKAAGVRPGQFKWLRASAGSYAEKELPGSGSRLLGHRSELVFRQHYECQEITRSDPIQPPDL
jgi:integrase